MPALRRRVGFNSVTLVVLSLLLLTPGSAFAHMSFKTMEFYGGIVHPWINYESALILCAVGLWIVQWINAGDMLPLGLLTGAIVGGAGCGIWLQDPVPISISFLLAFLVGITVAGSVKLPRAPSALLVGILGVYSGYIAGVDAAPDVNEIVDFLGGVLVGGFCVPLFLIGSLTQRPQQWLRIAIRVVGSWIAAASLMLLALSLR